MVEEYLEQHLIDVEKFERQRIFWLKLSGFVVLIVLLMAVDFLFLGNRSFFWFLSICGMAVAVVWWYWTMRLIRFTLNSRLGEIKILMGVMKEFRKLKNDAEKLSQST
jgi:hypothetical protein